MYTELWKQQEKIAKSCGGGELGYTSKLHESRIKVKQFYERQFTTATNIFVPLSCKKRGCGLRQISACRLFRDLYPKMNTQKSTNSMERELCSTIEAASSSPECQKPAKISVKLASLQKKKTTKEMIRKFIASA